MMKFIAGPLTWAFVIIIGGLMITPGGIDPIVTNPGFRTVVGVFSVAIGAIGFYGMRGK